MAHLGELAALTTATCWAAGALCFEAAGKRVGSLSLNLIRLVLGLILLSLLTWALRGRPFPDDAGVHQWTWLGVSGLVGFAFGDLCLFRAYVTLGPRLSSVIMATAPPQTAILSYLALGERLDGRDLLGMALTMAGVIWAVASRRGAVLHGESLGRGIALAFCGALGQAGGLVLSKLGMDGYDPFAATQIRLMAGIVGFCAIYSLVGWWPRIPAAVRDRRAMGFATLGAVFGPVLGVSLSLYAVAKVEVGVAASIMATTPILIIPAVVVLKRERVGLGGVIGAVLAVAGVVVLFL